MELRVRVSDLFEVDRTYPSNEEIVKAKQTIEYITNYHHKKEMVGDITRSVDTLLKVGRKYRYVGPMYRALRVPANLIISRPDIRTITTLLHQYDIENQDSKYFSWSWRLKSAWGIAAEMLNDGEITVILGQTGMGLNVSSVLGYDFLSENEIIAPMLNNVHIHSFAYLDDDTKGGVNWIRAHDLHKMIDKLTT